jgi:predicted nucleic acid-binding protein
MVEGIKVLVDLNVLLDVLAAREPFLGAAASVWAAVETQLVEGLVAAHSLTTLHYLLARHTSRKQSRAAMEDLLRVFSVASVDEEVIRSALDLGWGDFEDGVQMAAAYLAGADYLVTRDPKDFSGGPVPVLQPEAFLALLDS